MVRDFESIFVCIPYVLVLSHRIFWGNCSHLSGQLGRHMLLVLGRAEIQTGQLDSKSEVPSIIKKTCITLSLKQHSSGMIWQPVYAGGIGWDPIWQVAEIHRLAAKPGMEAKMPFPRQWSSPASYKKKGKKPKGNLIHKPTLCFPTVGPLYL